MRIENSFHVAVPRDRAWRMLTDIERVADCLPGARLTEAVDTQTFACLQLATQYRDALAGLARRLTKPALVVGADSERSPVDVDSLDAWLRPAPAADGQTSLRA